MCSLYPRSFLSASISFHLWLNSRGCGGSRAASKRGRTAFPKLTQIDMAKEESNSRFYASDAAQRHQLSRIRHELRTPINHIIGYSEMLHEEVAELGRADLIKDLEKIQRGGRRLLELINEYFNPETFLERKWDPHLVLHELRTPVNHIIGYSELLQDLAAESGEKRLIPDLEKIHVAATRWLQLMEGYLFEPLDPNKMPAPILKASHEEKPASEINFLVRQPTSDDSPALPQKGCLLVVDDDASNRDMLARRLQRQGYEIFTAESGQRTLELVRERRFDLVLLDMIMPGLDGFQVLQQLKTDESLRHVPVLMISALDDIDGIVRCIEIGAEDYIAKPFNPVFLRARIGAALEKKRLRDQEQIYLKRIQEEQEKAERLLLNILPMPIAERLKDGEQGIADSFAEVTVLFGDLVGFTTLSVQILPAEMVKLLNEVFSAFDQLAGKHGLEKIKTIGDAYMAVSGLPTPRTDHAEAAAEMALDMQEDIACFNQRYGTTLQMRIGLNSGPVIAGIIGTKKFIYDLWGDTVNTASRMESHGKPGQIQVTKATFEKIQNRYRFESRGMIEIKGKGLMEAYWLMGRV